MRYLLDTHTLIWSIYDSKKVLPISDLLEDPYNEIFYSALSIWEISIKHSVAKLDISPEKTLELAEAQGFTELPVTARHTSKVERLRHHNDSNTHKDPFDMLLVSQAKEEGMLFLTKDCKIIHGYSEPCIMEY